MWPSPTERVKKKLCRKRGTWNLAFDINILICREKKTRWKIQSAKMPNNSCGWILLLHTRGHKCNLYILQKGGGGRRRDDALNEKCEFLKTNIIPVHKFNLNAYFFDDRFNGGLTLACRKGSFDETPLQLGQWNFEQVWQLAATRGGASILYYLRPHKLRYFRTGVEANG